MGTYLSKQGKEKKKARETSEEQSSWVVGDVDVKEDTREQEEAGRKGDKGRVLLPTSNSDNKEQETDRRADLVTCNAEAWHTRGVGPNLGWGKDRGKDPAIYGEAGGSFPGDMVLKGFPTRYGIARLATYLLATDSGPAFSLPCWGRLPCAQQKNRLFFFFFGVGGGLQRGGFWLHIGYQR